MSAHRPYLFIISPHLHPHLHTPPSGCRSSSPFLTFFYTTRPLTTVRRPARPIPSRHTATAAVVPSIIHIPRPPPLLSLPPTLDLHSIQHPYIHAPLLPSLPDRLFWSTCTSHPHPHPHLHPSIPSMSSLSALSFDLPALFHSVYACIATAPFVLIYLHLLFSFPFSFFLSFFVPVPITQRPASSSKCSILHIP